MKNKHLSFDDRLEIEQGLKNNLSFKVIGNKIEKNCTTISREIKNHYVIENKGAIGRKFNNCLNRHNCPHRNNCKCDLNYCENYVMEKCEKLDKPPYVCNGCKNKNSCTLTKHLYSAELALKEYKENLIESRTGITLTDSDLSFLEKLLYPLLVEQGQSIHVAFVNNKDKIMCCEKELYTLIDKGYFQSIRNINLPRKVRRRIRKKRKTYYKIDKNCLNGRKYEDFIQYMKEHPDTNYIEMDSVEGTTGGKVLLTLHFVNCSYMLAFLRDRNTSQSVIDIFNDIQNKIGLQKFKELFPVILTDNGSEFSNPKKIEYDENGNQRTKVFYCEPGRSDQKGACENNHEFIRRFIPQGNPFEPYSQEDISLMMSHINSYPREKLNDKTPISVFSFLYNNEEDDISLKLGIVNIAPNSVVLNKSIFK